MQLWNNIKKFLRRYWMPSAAAGMLGLSVTGGILHTQQNNSVKHKAQVSQVDKNLQKSKKITVKSPILNIKYQNDTLDHTILTLLFYSAGKITRYYVEGNDGYRMQLPYFAHEEWHRHNDESKYRLRQFTPLEYYKLCMHDEISANMAAILTARYEYLAAPNKAEKEKIIKRYQNTYMKFYFDEIAKGNIKPESKEFVDVQKERSLIANGTMKMWMKRYSRTYAPRIYRMFQRYIGRAGLLADSKQRYQKVMDHMYTIGGVNFAHYFEHDIETKEDKVLLAEQLPKIRFIKDGGVEIMNIVTQNSPLMTEVGIEKQTEIFQNLLISSQLKYMLRNKTTEELKQNPQIVNLCYRKIISSAFCDKTFRKVVNAFPIISENRSMLRYKDSNFEAVAQKMYTFRDLDLTSMITDFSPNNVPIKTFLNDIFEDAYQQNLLAQYFLAPQLSVQEEKLLQTKQETKPLIIQTTAKANRQRLSEVLQISLPNLREPILLYSSPEDEAEIFAVLREFEEIPQVFKNCNTREQQKYLQEHKKYASRMHHFYKTGRVGPSLQISDKER